MPAKKSYSVKRKMMEVDIELEDGTVKECVIKEMMGDALNEWTELQQGRARQDRQGNSFLAPIPKIHARLISLCLYDRADDKPIPMSTIETWPSSVQQGLFNDCNEVCGLNDEEREKAKKP